MDDRRLLKIGEAAKVLGTPPSTMRAWERSGAACAANAQGDAILRYLGFRSDAAATVGYARVSSHDRKADLDRQHAVLEAYCAAKGWQCTVVRDLGSNYRKKGLQRVLEMILRRQMKRLVLTHKDWRFGLVFGLCELQGVEVVNAGEQSSFEEELAKDVLEIIAVFSARLYGARSHKSTKPLDILTEVKDAVKELSECCGLT